MAGNASPSTAGRSPPLAGVHQTLLAAGVRDGPRAVAALAKVLAAYDAALPPLLAAGPRPAHRAKLHRELQGLRDAVRHDLLSLGKHDGTALRAAIDGYSLVAANATNRGVRGAPPVDGR